MLGTQQGRVKSPRNGMKIEDRPLQAVWYKTWDETRGTIMKDRQES